MRQVPHATTCKAQQHASESRYSKLSFTSYLCNKRAQTRMKLLAALARCLSLTTFLSVSLSTPRPGPWCASGQRPSFPEGGVVHHSQQVPPAAAWSPLLSHRDCTPRRPSFRSCRSGNQAFGPPIGPNRGRQGPPDHRALRLVASVVCPWPGQRRAIHGAASAQRLDRGRSSRPTLSCALCATRVATSERACAADSPAR